jgi:hypothetical protein
VGLEFRSTDLKDWRDWLFQRIPKFYVAMAVLVVGMVLFYEPAHDEDYACKKWSSVFVLGMIGVAYWTHQRVERDG